MSDSRRSLPAVSALLAEAQRAGLLERAARPVVVDAIRAALAEARTTGVTAPNAGWMADIQRRMAGRPAPSLVRVINATGVILHTNLGRAPLAQSARQALADACGYCTLEFDADQGERGSRQDHTGELLRQLTGAAQSFVTINAASALLLVLNTLAEGGETIVSRGELVEIGGGFRIPEILRKSGSTLVEIGTTNRTHLADYQRAVGAATRCALKVHRSNFRMSGFVSEASLAELVPLMAERGIPVVHDAGSGLLLDLRPYGLSGEPVVPESVASGAITVFSGDKLLGGPQAGIIVGPAEPLARIATNPLARALRPDKTVFAALEATLGLYRDRAIALNQIPTLAMLVAPADELRRRARRLARRIGGAGLKPGTSSVGGGAFPDADLPTTLVTVPAGSCEAMLAALRRHTPPVIARAQDGEVVLDVRTLADDEFGPVAAALAAARAG